MGKRGAEMVVFKCGYCKKEGEKPKRQVKSEVLYCDQVCRGMSRRKRVKVKCVACLKSFEVRPSEKARGARAFCSVQCSKAKWQPDCPEDVFKRILRFETERNRLKEAKKYAKFR